MKKILFLAITSLVFSSCTSHVFKGNVMLSTKSQENITRIAPVEEEQCDYNFLGVGTISDPSNMYDALLDKAAEKGGDVVVDFMVSQNDIFMIYPIFFKFCNLATGTAAKIQ